MRGLFYEISHAIDFQKGIFHTMREFTLRPGHAAREYVLGKRRSHFSPVKYLLLVSALAAFLNAFIPYEDMVEFEADAKAGMEEAINDSTLSPEQLEEAKQKRAQASEEIGEAQQLVSETIQIVFKQYFSVVTLLSVPLIAFFSFFFFYAHRVNYARHIVVNMYLSAHTLWLYIGLMCVFVLLGQKELIGDIFQYYFIGYLAYSIWMYVQFFQPRYKVWAGFKVVFMNFVFTVILMIVLVIAIGLYYAIRSGKMDMFM